MLCYLAYFCLPHVELSEVADVGSRVTGTKSTQLASISGKQALDLGWYFSEAHVPFDDQGKYSAVEKPLLSYLASSLALSQEDFDLALQLFCGPSPLMDYAMRVTSVLAWLRRLLSSSRTAVTYWAWTAHLLLYLAEEHSVEKQKFPAYIIKQTWALSPSLPSVEARSLRS